MFNRIQNLFSLFTPPHPLFNVVILKCYFFYLLTLKRPNLFSWVPFFILFYTPVILPSSKPKVCFFVLEVHSSLYNSQSTVTPLSNMLGRSLSTGSPISDPDPSHRRGCYWFEMRTFLDEDRTLLSDTGPLSVPWSPLSSSFPGPRSLDSEHNFIRTGTPEVLTSWRKTKECGSDSMFRLLPVRLFDGEAIPKRRNGNY